MTRFLLPALMLSLVAGTALAQSTPAAAPPPPAGAQAPAAAPASPQPGPNGMLPPPPPPPGGFGMPGGPGMAGGPEGHRPPPPPPPSPAAHVHLQRGDLMLDVKCADGESTKSCGDTVLQMLDRLQPRN